MSFIGISASPFLFIILFCSWLALRYYGEVALVADVAECRDATYEAFSPPQTPTAFCLKERRKRKGSKRKRRNKRKERKD